MVSLESKISYLSRINETPKLKAFHSFLLNDTVVSPNGQDLNESDEAFFGLITAIQSNNKEAFESYYNKKNKSNPNKESPSPFVNDDFLIFCLIVGITRFDCDKTWIKNIVSLRSRNAITITLDNIITENYYSRSILPEIVLIYFQLNSQALITNDLLTTTFKNISDNITLFEGKSDFHILCSIRAYDIIIELKVAPNGSEVALLRQFKAAFQKRIKFLAFVIQTIALIAFFYGLVKLLSLLPDIKKFFEAYDPIFTISGVLGFSIVGNLIPTIKRMTYEMLLRLFGYPKDLIEKQKLDS